jgi:hypothetical protein
LCTKSEEEPIIDRKGLEEAACECYAVIQKFDGTAFTGAELFVDGGFAQV